MHQQGHEIQIPTTVHRVLTFVLAIAFAGLATAQPTARPTVSAAAAKGAAKTTAPPARTTPATLAQLMKGVFFPNSNVIFAAQSDNPADIAPAPEASTSTDPLKSSYGKWEAVENSGLAIAEAASLLTLPGRKCSNGRAVPVQNADWAKLVAGVRAAGLTAYEAAKAKDQDKILDAADVMTMACSNCHDKYREKATPAERCK